MKQLRITNTDPGITASDRDFDYLKQCFDSRKEIRIPKMGDFIVLQNGTIERIAWDSGAGRFQTSDTGSFHISESGASFSGGLSREMVKNVSPIFDQCGRQKHRIGEAWFFHNSSPQAMSAVYITMPFKVWWEGPK